MKSQTDVATPEEYIAALDEPRRSEIQRVYDFVREAVPDLEPHMCSGQIGFGPYRYRSKAGAEGDWFRVGLASNKQYISLHACASVEDGYVAEMFGDRLGKVNVGRSCIRFKKFDDVDHEVLREVLALCASSDLSS